MKLRKNIVIATDGSDERSSFSIGSDKIQGRKYGTFVQVVVKIEVNGRESVEGR